MNNLDNKVPVTFAGFANNAQEALRSCILDAYGKYLTVNQINIIKTQDFIKPEEMKDKSLPEIYGFILREMLYETMHISCTKEYVIDLDEKNPDNKTTLELPFGLELEQMLIEYYAQKIATKFGIPIDKLMELDLEDIQKIEAAFNGQLEAVVFEKNAIELLKDESLKDLVDAYDENTLATYFGNLIQAGEDKKDVEEENKILASALERTNAIQIIKGAVKSFIKYVDVNGLTRLLEIPVSGSVAETYYKRKLATLKPGESLDPEQFFNELKRYASEMPLMSSQEVQKDALTAEQASQYDLINTSEKIREAAKDDQITHSSDMGIHVVEETNDVIFTNPEGNTASVVSGDVSRVEDGEQIGEQLQEEIVSKEQYEILNNRFNNGERLTQTELEQLQKAHEKYGEVEKPAVLKPNSGSGFTLKTFALYFILLTIFIGTVVAIVLFK